MLREDLRPSVLERPCSGEVMLFCLTSVFSQVSSIGVTSAASPSCCIILTYIRRMTRGFRGPGRCEVTFFTDRWRGLRLFRRCLTSGVFRWLFGGCSGRLCASGVRASLSLAAATLRWGTQGYARRTTSLEESLTLTSVSFPSSTLAHGNSGAHIAHLHSACGSRSSQNASYFLKKNL